jgi:hypothetical protein
VWWFHCVSRQAVPAIVDVPDRWVLVRTRVTKREPTNRPRYPSPDVTRRRLGLRSRLLRLFAGGHRRFGHRWR